MANLKLIWKNIANNAQLNSIGSSGHGSWVSTLPIENLKDRTIAKVARTSSDANADTKFHVDLLSALEFDHVALVNHNLSSAATLRVTVSASVDLSSPLYQSAWLPAYSTEFAPSVVEWEHDNWYFGMPGDADLDRYQRTWALTIPTLQTARYISVEIKDASNTDGYVQAGRLFVGKALTFLTNYDLGATVRWVDDTIISRAISGAIYADRRKKRRKFTFQSSFITDNQAFQDLFELQRLLGVSGEVLVIPDADDAVNGFRRNFLGRLVTLDPIEHYKLDLNKQAFDIEELI